ncbi:peptidase M23-like protein [Aneurinibacillus soli]|uniref:Stage IV sporulation protein FA n=1 Tax=Aneurinibacillus soli TaxID=1500254 RepID=A0A0U5AT86_9BACL|nr:M23 family metallopeptidase [Aneurinibacillus soli]PYE62439.1 peptidase M23-like protein [Aneurinibacillus soli]BAU27002.1 Stage IV sporulation protein FA [Aneurinibacillus soli]
MSFYDTDGIKRRREERVRRLREQMEDTYSSYFFDEQDMSRPYEEDEHDSYRVDRAYRERYQDDLTYERDERYEQALKRYHEHEEPYRRYDHAGEPYSRYPGERYIPAVRRPGNRPQKKHSGTPPAPMRRGDKWLIKIIASLFVLSTAYIIQTVPFPGAEKYRAVLGEVFDRSYDFGAMSAWYEQKFGAVPTLLPAVGAPGNEAKPVLQSQGLLLKAPSSGKVIQTFAEQGSGVFFTPGTAEIRAVDQGWVTFAGQKEGLGNTVIIQHAKGVETWYSGLGSVSVKQNDWIEVQKEIGRAATADSKVRPVYFAVKKNGQFIDPQGVVRFD